MRAELLEKYNGRQRAIVERLQVLDDLLHDPARWWNRTPRHAAAVADFAAFAANIARNFGPDSAGHLRINADAGWARWRAELLAAIIRYPSDRAAWEAQLCAALRHWLHRRQRPERYARLAALLATQKLSREQLLDKQRRDLHDIVRFAAGNTAFYRERYGALAASFAGDITRLPILHKADVVAHLPEMLARGADPRSTKIGHTGGSTGKPLAFYYDEAKHELMRAGMMRSYMLSGWRPGQKILNFWGARQDTVAGGVFGGDAIGDFIAAEKTLPAHSITEERLQAWVAFIQRYRPVLLQGYASILAALARYVSERRLTMPASLRGVYSTAEVLDAAQRQSIADAFACPVFNQYGSREIPNIACECRHGNMHVFTDMVWLESVGRPAARHFADQPADADDPLRHRRLGPAAGRRLPLRFAISA